MDLRKVFFPDFETHAIKPRPEYPPKPVGLSIRVPGARSRYYAWGHPCNNNATMKEARDHMLALYRDGWVGCWHNAGFDLDVGEVHMDLPWPSYHHDTLILAFLDDPRQARFSLKPLAEKELGEPPTERDELKDWIIANVPEARKRPKDWGTYIACSPGDLCGTYANGDTSRSEGLYKLYRKRVLGDRLQRQAYAREIACTRVLIRMERRGVPVGTRALATDIPKYRRVLKRIENALMDRLRVAKTRREDFKWSGEGFADQLERARVIKEWILTDKGNRSTSVDSLREVGVNTQLCDELETRAQIETCLTTFMQNWHDQGQQYDGRFYARFNQVRQDYHGGGGARIVGTSTGRLSMSPNLQNAPRGDKDPRVPVVRKYIVPGAYVPCSKGSGIIKQRCRVAINKRDYSQQELRILAHHENGPLLAKYIANPKIDAHVAVKELIYELTVLVVDRRQTKDLNFGLIYGMGLAKLALKLGVDLATAKTLFRAHMKALPGVKALKGALKFASENNEPFYTWGGRKYYCEPKKEVKGRTWDFWYKMLNVLIQGGAADCTKEAMVNYLTSGADDRFPLILQVHDELLTLSPYNRHKEAHRLLNDAMLSVDFKVPMLSDGSVSCKSWGEMVKVQL